MHTVNVTIDRLSRFGEGVATYNGQPLYIDGVLPGEHITCRITQQHATYARGRLEAITDISLCRVMPVCPVFGHCGGCQLMHLDYEAQLGWKRERVIEVLGVANNLVAPCLPSPKELAYRNKMILVEGRGLYASHSHDVVAIDRCPVHCEQGEAVVQRVRRIMREMGSPPLQHLLVRSGVHAQQTIVGFVTDQKATDQLRKIASALIDSSPTIVGVVHGKSGERNRIIDEQWETLAGQSWVEERFMDLDLALSPASFFQVNPWAAKQLYQHAIRVADLQPTDRVVDAYCGIGLLSLLCSSLVSAATGIEVVSAAVSQASYNAERNKRANCRFVLGQVEQVLPNIESADVLFLNPPRKGCVSSVLDQVAKLGPRRVIYISCNPVSLARDLHHLTRLGGIIEGIQPIDLFPQTFHVEVVATVTFPVNNSFLKN